MQKLRADPTALFQKKRTRPLPWLPLFLAATFLLQLLGLFVGFFNGVQANILVRKPVPVLVQLVDGRALKVAPEEALHREPQVIDRLVREWSTLTLNWSGKFPNGDPDRGMNVGGGKKIPTSPWVASFILSEDFRSGFLKYLAENWVKPGVFEGQIQTALQVEQIRQPKSVIDKQGRPLPGHWQVEMVANLLEFDLAQPIGTPSTFNKRLFLRAVPPPLYPLIDTGSEIQKAVYKLRQAGLEIYHIEDLDNA